MCPNIMNDIPAEKQIAKKYREHVTIEISLSGVPVLNFLIGDLIVIFLQEIITPS